MKDEIHFLYELQKKNFIYSVWSRETPLLTRIENIKEEVDEAIEEVKSEDWDKLKDELGDVLWDCLGAVAKAELDGHFSIKEILDHVRKKYTERKPYILEERHVTIEEETKIWKEVKAKQKEKMNEEQVTIVNENNVVIGSIPRSERNATNWNRAANILVFNSKGELFVHQRTTTKDVYPDYYDLKVGGYVSDGESYLQTALREMEEELGINEFNLKELFTIKIDNSKDKVFSKVFTCELEGPFTLQQEEIQHGKFMTLEDVKNLIETEKVVPGGITALNRYLEGSNVTKN